MNRFEKLDLTLLEKAHIDYGFAEAISKLEDATPIPTWMPYRLARSKRLMRLQRIKREAQDVLIDYDVPAADWGCGECEGR